MDKFKKIVMAVACLICIFLIVSITMKNVNPIVIERVDPVEIKAGEDFYLFEGKPTMSVYGKGFVAGDIIYINGEPQDSAVGDSGWMTCFVDKKLYQKSGELKVQVKRSKETSKISKKSNLEVIKVVD